MWCPPGYITLHGFDEICREAAEILFPGGGALKPEPREDGTLTLENDPTFYAMFAQFWFLVRYVERVDTKVSLCSPKAEVVDIPGDFFVRRERGDGPDYRDISPLSATYDDLLHAFIGHMHGWTNVDDNGVVCAPRYHILARTRGHLRAAPNWKHFPSAIFNSLRSAVSDWREGRHGALLTKRFAGWSVCFRDGTYPSDAAALLDFFKEHLSDEAPPESASDLRHAGMRSQIATILGKEFPEGLDGIPAKVLRSALSSHFAKLPHEDTVRRAIGRKK